MVCAALVLLALSRAEIIERFKSPVSTQADGLVRVYADCPEAMRREYQSPVARFASDTVQMLYRGLAKRPIRFSKPGIVITVGDGTNRTEEVVTRVATNEARVVTRIRLVAPGYADLDRYRLEVIKAFYRSVEHRELTDEQAIAVYRRANPALRIFDERMKLENWLAGNGMTNDEEGIALMRRVFEPGKASRRDVLIFASRLFLYPPRFDLRFAGRYGCLSFREAVELTTTDPATRMAAYVKANEMPIMGGGRGAELTDAADAYRVFLLAFAAGEKTKDELLDMLDAADAKLSVALERAK